MSTSRKYSYSHHKGYYQDSRLMSGESRQHPYDRRSRLWSCRPAEHVRPVRRDQYYRPRPVERRNHPNHDYDRRPASRPRPVVGEVRHSKPSHHERRRYEEQTHRRPSVMSVSSASTTSGVVIEEPELVIFPELLGTLVTPDMELEMEKWRQECAEFSENVKDAADAGLARKRSFTEMAGEESCVSGPSPKIHVNPHHVAFRHFHLKILQQYVNIVKGCSKIQQRRSDTSF